MCHAHGCNMADETLPAADALRGYMQRTGVTQSGLAGSLGTDQPTVSRWLAGTARPTDAQRAALALISGGTIERDAWLRPDERAIVERARAAAAAIYGGES